MNKCRYVRPNDRQILRGIEAGWPYEVCERGYDIFDFGNTGILGIEAIDDGGMQSCPARIIYDDLDMNLLKSDAQLWEATKWNGTSTSTT